MEQLALYREWRPQLFSQVVGQEHVCRTLRNAITQGRLAHAYLFCGPRGTGKTSTARILAKAVNCPNCQEGEPCNTCPSCRSITSGTHFDVLELDAASNRGIDDIRDLKQKAGLAPTAGRYKFYIIDEVHMLSGDAFNALLKTLEEPPGHTIFVLATTEVHKVPATILSRCQRFDFRRLGSGIIADHLREIARSKGWEAEEGALQLIARQAGGALRDALGLLDQAASFGGGKVTARDVETLTGSLSEQELEGMLSAVFKGDIPALLGELDRIFAAGCEPRQLLYQLTDYVRELLLSGRAGGMMLRCAAILHSLALADAELRGSARPDLVLELSLLRLSGQVAPGERPDRQDESGAQQHRPVRRGDERAPAVSPRDSAAAPGQMELARADRREAAAANGGAQTAPATAATPQQRLGELKSFLENRLKDRLLLRQALSAAELQLSGSRVLLHPDRLLQALLQKEDNSRILGQAVKDFNPSWELEIKEETPEPRSSGRAGPVTSPEEAPPPAPARSTRVHPGEDDREEADDLVGMALSLFKGEIINQREEGD